MPVSELWRRITVRVKGKLRENFERDLQECECTDAELMREILREKYQKKEIKK